MNNDPDGMKSVYCLDCGEFLGYVTTQATIDRERWVHVRCMGRVAKRWGVPLADVNSIKDMLMAQLGGLVSYLDPGSSPKQHQVHGRIAAESTLELLAVNGLRVVPIIPASAEED